MNEISFDLMEDVVEIGVLVETVVGVDLIDVDVATMIDINLIIADL